MGSHKIAPSPEPQPSNPFVSDSPVTDPELDRFKRFPFATRIAETLARRNDQSSIVVLIHGEWGEGKTTVLGFVHEALCRFDNVIPVRFNPWRVSDETSLLLNFFQALADALDKSLKTRREKLGDLLRTYGGVASGLALEVQGAKLSVGGVFEKIGEKLALVPLEDQKARIDGLLKESGKRVVVFLDDIDRLEKKTIQSVFKLLKLIADFTNVSYVLAFDRDIVAQAIAEMYGAGDARAGYEYLEKIIQVNLNLPLADRESLAELCIEGLNEALRIAGVSLTPEQENEFQAAFVPNIFPELRTPRLAKLYANSVAFVVPLLASEINTGHFGLDYGDIVDRGRNVQRRLKDLLEKLDPTQAKHAELLLTQLFPQLKRIFRAGEYGGDEAHVRSHREQRVSSHDYLLRYLTCSIPSGDISDSEIGVFLSGISGMRDEELDARYQQLIRPNEERKLLFKLGSRTGDIPSESAKRLCLCIARLGSLLPDPPGEFVRLFGTAGLLFKQVLEQFQEPDRKELARIILASAEPIGFGVGCLSWMQRQRDDPEASGLFSPADEDDLAQAFAERISQYAANHSLITGKAEDMVRLLSTWQRARGSAPVQEHVARALAVDPQSAEKLLITFSSFIRTGMPGIDQGSYEAAIKLVNPEDLVKTLRLIGLLDAARTDDMAQHAQQFAAIYGNTMSE